ncbi:YggT family protein, partial [Gammaproteobacteria bacterium]|nr:YggT family protein [Gammaproteobacteria bacterium]
TLTLFYISVIDVLNSGFRILFYCVIGSVVLSWVAPGNNHPLLQIIEEISAGILSPVRKFLPPIIGLLVLNLINSSLVQIISSLV